MNLTDSYGRTPLDLAVMNQNLVGVRQLLRTNCAVNTARNAVIASLFMAAAVKEGILLRNITAAQICDHFTVGPPGSGIREVGLF